MAELQAREPGGPVVRMGLAAGTQAWHFDFKSETNTWIAARQGDELLDTLERVVSDKLGHALSIPRA